MSTMYGAMSEPVDVESPVSFSIPEGPSVFVMPDGWYDAYIFANTHYPQTFLGIVPLVANRVLHDIASGEITYFQLMESKFSQRQVSDLLDRTDKLHAAYGIIAPPIDAGRLQRLWYKVRFDIADGINLLCRRVFNTEPSDQTLAEIRSKPQFKEVLAFLSRVDSQLRTPEALEMAKQARLRLRGLAENDPRLVEQVLQFKAQLRTLINDQMSTDPAARQAQEAILTSVLSLI